jgi:excisionase family DNA binding protein
MQQKAFCTEQLLEAQNELLRLSSYISEIQAKITNALFMVVSIPTVQEEEKPDLMDYKEVSKEFNIPISTLYTQVCNGEIPCIKMDGKRTKFSRQELTEFYENAKIPAKSQILNGTKKL